MIVNICRWLAVLVLAALAGKLITKVKMPSILGWLIVGMFLGPNALGLMPQTLMDADWYKIIITWMQCAFGLMLGTELIWKKIRSYGKALLVTTLTQSLGTFALVSLLFGFLFRATAPAPALSIVQEFHTRGPVTDTLLPMAVLDDIVGIAVFFTVNAFVARTVAQGAMPLYMIPVMIFLPILIGAVCGIPVGLILKKYDGKKITMAVLLGGITVTMLIGRFLNTQVFRGISLNYMLMGVSFSAVFSNMLPEDKLTRVTKVFHPVLSVSLLAAIVDLGAPLDYHLVLGAGLYTVLYIVGRAVGKYSGARIGARIMHMPKTVQQYLGLTLLPHSGVSLVFTGIICTTLSGSEPQLATVVKGTIAAAAVINEIIAVIAAKKGFELAGEI